MEMILDLVKSVGAPTAIAVFITIRLTSLVDRLITHLSPRADCPADCPWRHPRETDAHRHRPITEDRP